MKGKKIYISILVAILLIICLGAGIFYIITNNKSVTFAEIVKNLTNEGSREAILMENSEIAKNTKEVKDETGNVEENKQDTESEQKQEESVDETQAQENTQVNTAEITETAEKTEQEPEKKEPEFTVEPLSKTMYVKSSSLNVRSGPGTNYSAIGKISYGGKATITGKTGQWYQVKYGGKVGYVKAEYLSNEKPEVQAKTEDLSTANKSQTTAVSKEGLSTVGSLIIINSRSNKLSFYRDGNLVKTYRCATGTSGTPTPQGKFSVFEKLKNRPYYKENIAGGAKNNPLGPRWMQFKSGGYAIHGTNSDSSIGKNASHGCVRMHNSDVIELYGMVSIGTTVIVKNTSKSNSQIAADYGIFVN